MASQKQPQTETENKAAQRGGYSHAALRERGWTDSVIDKVLGWPDVEVTNPYYPSAPPMRLYALARVRLAETKAAVRDLQAAHKRPRKHTCKS